MRGLRILFSFPGLWYKPQVMAAGIPATATFRKDHA
jgi:hypothetical protein